MSYILKYHPRFKDEDIPVWLDRQTPFNIEGGDELVLSKEVLAIEFPNARLPKRLNV